MDDITYQPADILCVGAHPDDVEMGMGGTVAALTAAGKSVAILNLTRGELGTYGTVETRAEESAAAAEVLQCAAYQLTFPDGGVQDDLTGRHHLVRAIRQVQPRIVFTPYPYPRSGPWDGRANVDHLATGSMTVAAAKLARMKTLMPEIAPHAVQKIYFYMIPDHLKPHFVVDITEHADTMRRAIEAYATQMAISRGGRSIWDLLVIERQLQGQRIRVDLAEGFLSDDPLGGTAAQLSELL